ncbi:MAG: GNAT family N-acetyltransferase [Clostridia bacterium]|nr:GNAT family N-acetyltransferase [Clostridia bacterium]
MTFSDGVIRLEIPGEKYFKQYEEYREEFLASGDSMDGTGPLRRCDTGEKWLEEVNKYRDRETVPEGKVVATQFIGVRESDGRIVGMVQVRHYLNEYLKKYAGHIGYSVRPTERRKGFAKRMLALSLKFCRTIGIKKVMVSCLEENEASRRTIVSNGGVFVRREFEPDEKKYLEIYNIDLG